MGQKKHFFTVHGPISNHVAKDAAILFAAILFSFLDGGGGADYDHTHTHTHTHTTVFFVISAPPPCRKNKQDGGEQDGGVLSNGC